MSDAIPSFGVKLMKMGKKYEKSSKYQVKKSIEIKNKRYGETKPTKQYEPWNKYAPLTRQIKTKALSTLIDSLIIGVASEIWKIIITIAFAILQLVIWESA